MIAAILRTMLLLWSLVGPTTTIHAEQVALLSVTDDRGIEHRVPGYMDCRDDASGNADVWIATDREFAAMVATLTHELAHAYDCLDDGVVNASPLPPDAQLRSLVRACWSSSAERYACWVVQSGRIR